MPKPSYFNRSIGDLDIGTYDNIEVAHNDTPIIEALNKFVNFRISALPIVDDEHKLIDIYAKFDVIVSSFSEFYLSFGELCVHILVRLYDSDIDIDTYLSITTFSEFTDWIGVFLTSILSPFLLSFQNLAAEKTYNNLNVTLKEANEHRNEWFEGVHTCQKTDSLFAVMEIIVKAEVSSEFSSYVMKID